MATLIGIVRTIIGEVQVVAADGSCRLLVEGDRVFAGEQVLTGAGGAVAISLASGGELTLGRDSSLLLDEQMLAGASEGMEAAPPPTAQALTDIEQLQQVIAAGGDPTAELPPTAAGPGAGAAGGDGGGGISFVLLDETAGRVDPEIGYPTGPLAFDPLSPEELPAAPGLAETLDALPEDPTVVPEDPVVTPEDPVITPDDPVTTPEDPVITPEDPVVPPGDPVVPPVDSSPVVTVEHFTDASGTALAERGFVSEGGLPGGSGAGERPVVSFGRLAIDAPDGVQAIEVQDAAGNWVDVTAGGVVQGVYGTLVVTADGSWSYSLGGAQVHGDPAATLGDLLLDSFQVRVVDGDGDLSAPAALLIEIADDGPQAFDDSVTTPEDSAVTVNVLANDTRGADSPAQLVAASLVAGSGSVSFDAAGNVTFTPSAGFEGTANIRYTLRDADGDASEATLSVQVGADSKPTVEISYGPGNGVVDEAALDGGELGGGQAGSNPGSAAEQTSGTLTIQTGADSVGTVLIGSVLIDGVDVTAGGTVNGQYGTLQVTRSGEGQYSWTYTLSDNTLDHSGAGQTGSADQVLDVFSVQATDSEGDAAPAQSLTIRINDDGPQAFQPESVVILDQGAGTRVVSGDLHFAGQAGADGVGTVHFSIVEGSAALDSAGNQIRLDGEPLYLYYGSDETQLLARTAPDGITGFSIELDPAGDSYTLTTYGPLSVGAQEVSVTSLTSVGGGNAGYKALLDVGGTAQDVLLSSTTGTVNTDSDDIGVGQAQTLQAGENLRLDFVNSLAVADTSIGFTYDDHNRISEFRQKVFINGAKSATASLTVSAILADDDLVFGGSDPQESRVALDADDFRVWNGTQDVTAQVSITPNADGSVSLAGIKDGWVFSFSADTRFSALQIEADSGTSRFSLGFFTYSEIGDAAPIHMNQAITGYDSDGDSVSGSLSASLYPQGTAPLGAAGDVQEEAGIASDEVLADAGSDEPGDLPGDDLLAGGDAGVLPEGGQPAAGEDAGIDGAGDALPGSLAALVLEGGDGADLLLGAAGDDVLRGGDGNDVLAGGAGDDLLTGGAGADSFVWRAGESGTDRITDFTPGEDSLDLSELLVGAEGLDAAQSSSELASSLTGYLNVAFGSSTTITVDGDLGASQTIVLEGVDLSSVYASSDEATVIQNMLDDGSLKVV